MIDNKGTGTRDTSHGHEFREVLQGLLKLLEHIIKRQRITLSFVAGGLFLYLATPASATILTGAPFILIGEAIRTCASGFIKKDKELAQEGPYALTRNPLYLGNFLIGFGFSIMAGNLALVVIFLIIFLLMYQVTIKNEEEKLFNKFGDSFLEYKRRVPAFFPVPSFIKSLLFPSLQKSDKERFERSTNFSLNMDWHLVIQHKEHHTWLGIAGCMIVFIVKTLY